MPGNGMDPTILKGEGFYVNVSFYKNSPLKRGDVVMFRYPANPKLEMVKRIVGLGGDLIKINDEKLLINNKFVAEPYLGRERAPSDAPVFNYGPIKVPKGMVFVLGDNRSKSLDSRTWGFLPTDNILGKVISIYKSDQENRIGKKIR